MVNICDKIKEATFNFDEDNFLREIIPITKSIRIIYWYNKLKSGLINGNVYLNFSSSETTERWVTVRKIFHETPEKAYENTVEKLLKIFGEEPEGE